VARKRTDICEYAYCYRITYPNGKVYIGADYSDHADLMGYSYLGSMSKKGKAVLRDDMQGAKSITIQREIIWEGRGLTVSEVISKGRELIAAHDSRNPDKGYNLN
jgi:hypothetical protein